MRRRGPLLARLDLVEYVTDGADDIEVCAFASRPDIVGLAHAAMLQHAYESPCVVLDVKPIADVLTVAIDRQFLLRRSPRMIMWGINFSGN